MRYHLTPVRMAVIKSLQIINAGEDVEKTESSHTVGGNVNWGNQFGKLYEVPYKTKNRNTIGSSNPTPGHISGKDKNSNSKDTCTPMFTAVLFIIQDMETT